MRALITSALKFRVLVIGVAVVVMTLGAVQLRNVSVDPYPEFAPPQVEIQTEALGLSATEVEQLVTVPLEQDLLNGVAWLAEISSKSMPGLSSVVMTFEPGTDLLKARQAVQERLTQAYALPPVGSPPTMINSTSSTSRVMMIGVSSKSVPLVDMSFLARWKIRPKLMGVPGVANVTIFGQRDRQLQVQLDPSQLHSRGVTLDQVINTAGNALWVSPLTFVEASTPGTGGFIDTSTQRFSIQHILPITTARDLATVTVEDTAGALRLSDVATVAEGHQPLIGDAVVDGGPGLIMAIDRAPGASIRDVTDGVEQALDELRPGLVGISLDGNLFRAETLSATTSADTALWFALALAAAVLVLGLAFWSWRRTLITFLAIALSLVSAAAVLLLRGGALDTMLLAGLALALVVVVDDAVSGVVAVHRRVREEQDDDPERRMGAVAAVSGALRASLMYATLVAVLGAIPLLVLDGVTGVFAADIAVAYLLAIGASTVVACSVTPGLALLLFRGRALESRPSPLARTATAAIHRTVALLLSRRRWTYATAATLLGILVVSLVPQATGGAQVATPVDRNLLVHWQAEPGTSLTEMTRAVTDAVHDVNAVPGVASAGATVGRAVQSDERVNVDAAELWVRMSPSADYNRTTSSIARVLSGFPGVRSQAETYAQDRLQNVEGQTPQGLVVRVYGIDLSVLTQKAEQIRTAIATVAGVSHPTLATPPSEPTLQVEVNLQAAERYGIKPGDVRRDATTFFSGLPVGSLYQDQAVFDVLVVGTPRLRQSVQNVSDMVLDTPTGEQVRLGDIASVRLAPAPTVINHDATSRYVDVMAAVSGRDAGAVVHDVDARIKRVTMPLEYHAEVLGNLAAQQNDNLREIGIVLAILLGVALLLQAALRSLPLAAVALLCIGLSGTGGVVAAWFSGGLMTLGALVGFLAVLAFAARNVILLVRDAQQFRSPSVSAAAATLAAARDRVGPATLSAVVTCAMMLPLVIARTAPGAEVLHPLGAVVFGGMITALAVGVLLAPALTAPLIGARAQPFEDVDDESEAVELHGAGAEEVAR
jgi:Cu/Ag efflux pump CusA